MKKVIFVAGPPGAGKSEFIKKYNLNKYIVFDLDDYREIDWEYSIHNPLKFSENSTKKAGILMNDDIINELSNDNTIIIETTFSSLNNTLEKIKKIKDRYDVFVYLFLVNKAEAFISTLERYIDNYNHKKSCRLISFEKFVNKYNFYANYIKKIEKYDIKIYYISRHGGFLSFSKKYDDNYNYFCFSKYNKRIKKIKNFAKKNNILDIVNELNKMLSFFENYDTMKRVIEMKQEKSCGAIVELDGKILIIQQKKSGNFGFPKGHMLPGESETETAIREVKEETNIDIEVFKDKRYSLSYIQNGNINKEVVYFLAVPKKDFKLSKQEAEISNIFWIDKEKVSDTLTYENLKNIWNQAYKELN